jgi:MerR-like DNA binding protein
MRIGEIAAQAGVNVQTIRFYERRGLIKRRDLPKRLPLVEAGIRSVQIRFPRRHVLSQWKYHNNLKASLCRYARVAFLSRKEK